MERKVDADLHIWKGSRGLDQVKANCKGVEPSNRKIRETDVKGGDCSTSLLRGGRSEGAQ